MTHNELPCEDYCVDEPTQESVLKDTLPGQREPFPRFGHGRFFEGAQPVRVTLRPRKISVDGNNRFFYEE